MHSWRRTRAIARALGALMATAIAFTACSSASGSSPGAFPGVVVEQLGVCSERGGRDHHLCVAVRF